MINNEFIDFITELSKKIGNFEKNDSEKTKILSRIAKLTEEVGELSSASLTSVGIASEKKLNTFDRKNLTEEFGDVIIVACLLAKELGIDIKKSLKIRKEEIEKRNNY